MRLIILLRNPVGDIPALTTLLRKVKIDVGEDRERLALKTELFGPSTFDSSDLDMVKDVWDEVRNFLTAINGLLQLERTKLENVKLFNMMYIDEAGQRQHMPITGNAHLMLPALRAHPPALAQFVPAAIYSPPAQKVLRLTALYMDWSNLYKIYEVIREDMRGKQRIISEGWTSNVRIDAFTGSANNSVVSGDAARHGRMKSFTPSTTMTLSEARSFIKMLTQRWLSERICT